MKTLLSLLAVAALAALVGCVNTAVDAQRPTDNPEIHVDLLFTDPSGCKVNRFHDDGEYHYYVICPSGEITTSSTIHQYDPATKTLRSRPEEITTGTTR